MTAPTRKREVGRGEKLLPGVWRLRLPLPWPGVPHCNAWAVGTGDGIVLFDTGMHEPGSMAHLERALDMVGLKVEHVRLLVCTHAHSDHYGQAATIVERAGCELWMHPDHRHMTAAVDDPDAAFERRMEVARSAGVPEEPLRQWAQARRGQSYGVAGIVAPDRDLLPGVTVTTDLGGVGGRADARPRAVARLPVAARAAAADLRRPSARPRVALLRLRLLAGPRGGVPGLAGSRRGARRAAVPARPRAHVRRRPGPYRGQPRPDRRGAWPRSRTSCARTGR